MPTFTLPYRLSQLQDYTAYLHAMQVGACVVLQEPHRAISVGYNGLPDGRKDESAIEYKDYGIYDSSNSQAQWQQALNYYSYKIFSLQT